MGKEKALELLNSGSQRVYADNLQITDKATDNSRIFTTGEITKYGTIYLNELDIYVKLESIFEIEVDGVFESVNWRQ